MSSVLQYGGRLRAQALTVARQMDWLRGLRAAVALCVPLVAGDVLGIPNLGWAALGGFEGILADTGGPYRSRMRGLLTLSVGGGLGVFVGSLVGGSITWALPVTIVWCFVWSYLGVLGQPFTTAGLLVQVVYFCGVGAPAANWRQALGLGLLLLAGGGWATLLSLFLWPLDPYRPARSAIAKCYEELGSFLGSVIDLSARSQQTVSLWDRLAQHHQYRIRRAVEHGWEAVAHVRNEQLAETVQMHHLVVLLENADMLIARTVALAEHLENQVAVRGSAADCVRRGMTGLAELQDAERWVASQLVRGRSEPEAGVRAKRDDLQKLPRSLEACMGEVDAAGRFLLEQVAQSASVLDAAVESAALLRLGRTGDRSARVPSASAGHFGYVYERIATLRQGWNLDLLAANLTRDSLILRHAARVSLVCGLDVALITVLHINHGYWLLMTSLIVLQPHVSGTLRRGLERIGGTVAGGMVAALLAMTLHSQTAAAAVLFPFALLALAVLPVSYAAFAFFLTPAFVLAWMPFAGDWQLALIRVGNTAVGAVIAVAGMLFLFPAYERDRAHHYLGASLEANRRYLAELAAAWRNRSRSSRALAAARRATGLAHNDSDESMERFLGERWLHRPPSARYAATFVTYLRRFAQGITTLTALEGNWDWKNSVDVQAQLELLERRLAWLEQQIQGGAAEGQWPDSTGWSAARDDHPGARQLERLIRHSNVLYRQALALRDQGWIS